MKTETKIVVACAALVLSAFVLGWKVADWMRPDPVVLEAVEDAHVIGVETVPESEMPESAAEFIEERRVR